MTDWPQRLRLAAALRIPPAAFWRLSVKEWAALTAPPPSATLGRGELQTLMAAHPDAPSPLR